MGHVALCVLFLFGFVLPALTDKHSLYYIYTALSKPVTLPGIYEFTALGLLDGREIDYYNSQNQVKVPRQDWMNETMQADYWEKGTQSRKSKQQWFKVNVDILMGRMRQNNSDLHILQWRHGCEIEENMGGVKFLRGTDEYSYDGEDFLSFDGSNTQWIAPVPAAEPTKRKWDDVPILNQYTKGYLERECVDWLTKFMEYGKESLRKGSLPHVYAFAKKCASDSNKLTLTCLATGFYPKDVTMSVRKYRTSLPEGIITSSGVRPNDDDTYQLRKSLDILENEKADYDCYVTHSSLKEPISIKWDGKCNDCLEEKVQSGIIGGVIGIVLTLALTGVVIVLLKKTGICSDRGGGSNVNSNGAVGYSSVPVVNGGGSNVNSNGAVGYSSVPVGRGGGSNGNGAVGYISVAVGNSPPAPSAPPAPPTPPADPKNSSDSDLTVALMNDSDSGKGTMNGSSSASDSTETIPK